MKIAGISFKTPSNRVTNSEILNTIEKIIEKTSGNNLEPILNSIKTKLQNVGIKERRLYEDGEPWFPNVKNAITDSLDQAEMNAQEIDCIIYCSVYRTVLEPSMGCLIAKAMGMPDVSAFDINEACGGWARAISVAQAYLQTGMYKKILLVTNEVIDNNKLEPVKLSKVDDLEWAFPTYTLGSGATATILVNSNEPWDIQYGADNKLAEYCLFPISQPKEHEHHIGDVNSLGQGHSMFTCYGRKMQLSTYKQVVRFLGDKLESINKSDFFFPHTQAYKPYIELPKILKVNANIYSLFPEYGNIVTNSIPASIADAKDNGGLKRGDNVFGVVPASGLSMTSLYFTY